MNYQDIDPGHGNKNWRGLTAVSLGVLVIITAIAGITQLWVLTAIPIGFLFGFFLQKGDLCGASAFSEVILMRSWRKVWGIWVCIATGMVGFALLDLLGWVTLNPKPLFWANCILGGAMFGAGIVLAGGCVSGSLFKAGAGNLNSMVALPGIALGAASVDHGVLNSASTYLKTFVSKAADGGPVTIPSVTGLPYWLLALLFAGATLLLGFAMKRGARTTDTSSTTGDTVLTRSWKPWQAGLLIGLLGAFAYLSSAASGRNYPLGTTHGVLHAQLLITDHELNHVFQKKPRVRVMETRPPKAGPSSNIREASVVPAPSGKKVSWWLIVLVTSLVVGSWVSGRLSGQARLLHKPPEQVVIAFIGGLLAGSGAAIGGGCVIGNIISGWALMSVGSVLFGVVAVLANWITTYVYLMGGSLMTRQ